MATVNEPTSWPAAIVTLAGTVATGELDERDTTAPPDGAATLSRIEPLVVAPPVITVAVTWRRWIVAGLIVRTPTVADPFSVAATFAVVTDPTAAVEAENVTLWVAAATVTLVGTVALAESLVNETVVPPGGALPVRVTVPMELRVPVTAVGLNVTLAMRGAATVRSDD